MLIPSVLSLQSHRQVLTLFVKVCSSLFVLRLSCCFDEISAYSFFRAHTHIYIYTCMCVYMVDASISLTHFTPGYETLVKGKTRTHVLYVSYVDGSNTRRHEG